MPHHVALLAEALRGAANSMPIYGLVKELGGVPMPYHLERDGRDPENTPFNLADDRLSTKRHS